MGNNNIRRNHTNNRKNTGRKKLATIKKAAKTAGILIAIYIVSRIAYTNDARADYTDNELYTQLVTNQCNEVAVDSKGELPGIYEILSEVVSIDKEDTLYDGAALSIRGRWKLLKKGESYSISAGETTYDLNSAEKMANEIVDEVKKNTPDDATDREKFYEYLRYMSKNFYYDKDCVSITDEYFNGDKGVDCKGYSLITYLVANKMDIDCEIITSTNHVFNAVKFDDSESYITFDLTRESKYAGMYPIMLLYNTLITELNPNTRYKNYINACNSGKEYAPAGIGELIEEIGYYSK